MRISRKQYRYAIYGFIAVVVFQLIAIAYFSIPFGFEIGLLNRLIGGVLIGLMFALLLFFSASLKNTLARRGAVLLSVILVIFLHMKWPW